MMLSQEDRLRHEQFQRFTRSELENVMRGHTDFVPNYGKDNSGQHKLQANDTIFL
ncbi:hypothetical protein PZB74_00540 [Porifericola rhodea]|uniref:hypothetical protein n=1 Tax=Porifericola rhodea TaxID=930972 RepID=UPI0026652772|nr:hypothetical protein [Porifericola rhodea]WKN31846.1 hypothetical protein PZB74_00540 [Porifericola rhodea]